eukprot:2946578-Alexandrium_andersonii.AAC.1
MRMRSPNGAVTAEEILRLLPRVPDAFARLMQQAGVARDAWLALDSAVGEAFAAASSVVGLVEVADPKCIADELDATAT